MNTLAIIQARLESTRLPKKVLAEICGRPILDILIRRVSATRGINQIIVAVPDSKTDDELADWVEKVAGLECFRGSEHDVLDRFYQCAKKYNADLIVRITADDPLKDPEIIQEALSYFHQFPSIDYCSNTISPTYPEGLDIEVFRFQALERAWKEAKMDSEREHVTPYIWKNSNIFNIYEFKFNRNLSAWRWTVDKPSDLEFMRIVFEYFKVEPLISFRKVIEYMDLHPEILRVNAGTIRNEGYFLSTKRESDEYNRK